jgi:hypothetical protein
MMGAGVAALSVGTTLVSIYNQWTSLYKNLATSIAFVLGFELVTGSLLAASNPGHVSFIDFCRNIILYLGTLGAVEGLLFYQMKKAALPNFPAMQLASSIAVGIGASAYTALLLF